METGVVGSVIDVLPEELLLKILSYLCPYYDYETAQLVCQKWCRVVRSLKYMKQRIFRQCVINGHLSYKTIENNSIPPGLGQERSAFRNRGIRRGMNQSRLEPAARFSHSSCLIGNKMFIFGGCSLTNSAFNDLHELDLKTRKWERVLIRQGFMPAPRECASMVASEKNLVLFGGWCSPRFTETATIPKFFNDTSLINVEHRTCTTISSGEKETPGTRAGHNACISGGKMIVFGGAQRILRYDDVWFLDMDTSRWHCPAITGKKPGERFGHSQFSVGPDHVVVIGGCGGSNSLYDDAWLLNTCTWAWSEIKVENKLWQAPDLWCHPSVVIGDQMVTFSDQIICNSCLGLKTNPLESSLFAGPVPVPWVVCVKCKHNKVRKQHFESHFQMFALDFSEVLSCKTVSWGSSPSFVTQHVPRARSLFSIVAGKGEILIFGGVFNSEKLKMTNTPPKSVIIASAS